MQGAQGNQIPIPRNYLLYSQEDVDMISQAVGKIHCELNEGMQVAGLISNIVAGRQEQFREAIRQGKVEFPMQEEELPADDGKPKVSSTGKSRLKPTVKKGKKAAAKKKKGK